MARSPILASRWTVRAGVVLAVGLMVLALYGPGRDRTPLNFHERDLIRRAEPEPPLGAWLKAQTAAISDDRDQRAREGVLARIDVGAETWLIRRLPIPRELLGALLHAAAVALFIALVFSLERERTLALLAGVFFALHPVHAQSVTWTAARGLTLAGTLLLAAALLLSRIRPAQSAIAPSPARAPVEDAVSELARSALLALAAMALYGAACLGAPAAVGALPLLLLVALRRLQTPRPLAAGLILLAAAVVVFGFGRVPTHVDWWIGGAMRDLANLLWPFWVGPMDGAGDAQTWVGVLMFFALAAASLFAPERLAFYAAWTLLSIAAMRPAGAVGASSTDLYLAAGGFAAILALAARHGAQATSGGIDPLARLAGPFVPIVLTVIFAALCVRQIGVFRDDLTFWRSAARIAPDSWEAHHRLGIELQARGYLIGAAEQYRTAITIAPRTSAPYTNLGVVREIQGKSDVALTLYTRAATINPYDEAAWRNLSLLYADLERWSDAEAAARKAVEIDPTSAQAHSTLGAILLSGGAPGAAQAELLEAIRLDPRFADAHFNLGIVYERRARYDDALHAFERAVRLDPANTNARIRLEALRAGWRGPVRGSTGRRMIREGS